MERIAFVAVDAFAHGAQRLDLSRHRHALRMVYKEAPRSGARCTILGGVPRPLALCPPSQVLDVRQAVRCDAAVDPDASGIRIRSVCCGACIGL